MQKIPVTTSGHKMMTDELAHLKSVARPEVIQAIATAREHGDLSENAEYSAAREKQSFVEGRIKELEDKIGRAEIIDPASITSDMVQFGATVDLEDDNGNTVTYQIVGEIEASVEAGRININSPLARALLGKVTGDFFTLQTPGGKHEYEVLALRYE